MSGSPSGRVSPGHSTVGDLTSLVVRFARAAGVDPGLAARCCQARAVSAYLHQEHTGGAWFDREVLLALSAGIPPLRPSP